MFHVKRFTATGPATGPCVLWARTTTKGADPLTGLNNASSAHTEVSPAHEHGATVLPGPSQAEQAGNERLLLHS
jgi:hypothetical protein